MAKRRQLRLRFPDWLPHAAILAALAVAAYAGSFSSGFIGDDKIQLLKNPLLLDLANIPRLFGSGVWSILGIAGNYYRPLPFLVYMLVYQLAGFHPAAFHSLMILLHALNTVLLYFLVRRLAAGRVPLAASALFAVHPIHTEVVDWIAALPDLMVTTLALLGVLWFARRDPAPRGFRILGHCAIYLLALLTKETGVMLLPLYVAFGWFQEKRGSRDLRHNVILYAAMLLTLGIYLAMRIAALGGLAPGQRAFFYLGPIEFALSAIRTAAQYLGALLFPANLNYFHVFHPAHALTLDVIASALALAAAAAIFFRTRTPLIAYGIFWVAVTIAPALNLTGVGQNVFAERYLYLPSAGFCWVAAWAWNWLAERRPVWARVAGVVVLLLCIVETASRNRDWRDDFTLLQVTLRQSPASAWLHNSMAGVYVERNEFDKALDEERLAVQYEPGAPVYRKNLGNILLGKDPRAAAAEFEKVLELQPANAEVHCDLALAREAAGDQKRAAAEYQTALQLQPTNREAAEGYRRTVGSLR